MRHTSTSTGDQLVNALHTLGVNFLMGGKETDETLFKHPTRLITKLAQSEDARLRLSLIPLLLEHPEYASHVRNIAEKLELPARLTLQCYYSVAVWLSKKHQRIDTPLPNHFSKELNLTPVDDPEENLRALAKRHKELSGSYVNWLATYRHAEQVWRKRLEYQKG
ncbi:MAG TPA: hypothetical protein VLA72_09410 [Anaerolineales bacterium]|nr:hypothetical protein [Anaerolineales bacterium]